MSRKVVILGYPIGHSISPLFQQATFDHLSLDVRYEAWETHPDDLTASVERLRQADFLGANITVPHKEVVSRLLEHVEEPARLIGAVNTLVNRDGLLTGHNTDAEGFLRALTEDGGFDPKGRAILLLGAGGVARAVAYTLAREGSACIAIANRTLDRARKLAEEIKPLAASVKAVSLETHTLKPLAAESDLIVNCTSLGMWHGADAEKTPLTAELIPPSALVVDLVYSPPETPLLKEAIKAGASILPGLPMLVYQGAASFRLWTGLEPPLKVMFNAARRALR